MNSNVVKVAPFCRLTYGSGLVNMKSPSSPNTLSRQAAIAIYNSELYEQTKSQAVESPSF
jgi:hypothetical protein